MSKAISCQQRSGSIAPMEEQPKIEAEITFLSEADGGRKSPPSILSGCVYRPHLVVGDPKQRRAITSGNASLEKYIGVAFSSCPEKVEANIPFTAQLELIYYPDPIYDALVLGATFTIREGAKIVGYGRVMKRIISRIAGLHSGAISTSDDFDKPLSEGS